MLDSLQPKHRNSVQINPDLLLKNVGENKTDKNVHILSYITHSIFMLEIPVTSRREVHTADF